MARHMMTARRKAALRKAQLASARKRKGRKRTAYKHTARSAYVAGLTLGRSRRANAAAGMRGINNYKKTKKVDNRFRIKKNVGRRLGGYMAGVYTTSALVGLASYHATNAGVKAYHRRKGY